MIAEHARCETEYPELQSPAADNEILSALGERRAGAFEALVAAYAGRLYSLVRRVTGNREDAEEVVQDAFVKAHRALLMTYSPARVRELSLRSWLFTVALNTARNHMRSRRHMRSLDEARTDGRPVIEPAETGPGPLSLAEGHELAAALERELARLPLRVRLAILLRMVDGLSYDEVATVLKRPVGTVKSDVHRGLRLLRRRLGTLLEE